MSGSRVRRWFRYSLLDLSGQRYFWQVRRETVLITVICLVAIFWAMTQIGPTVVVKPGETAELTTADYTARGLIIIAPLILGIAWTPAPKPEDHSESAAIAVDDLAEMHRANAALVDEINETSEDLAGEPNSVGGQILLLRITEELKQQRRQIKRQISRWARVSPGVEDEIVKGRKTNEAILAKLEGELDNDGKAEW